MIYSPFNAIIPSVQYFGSALPIHGHVYRKLNFASKVVEAWGLSDGKKVQDCDYVFGVVDDVPEKKGMDIWKQMSSKWSFTCICGIFPLKLFRDYSLYSVYILHPACVLLSVDCSLHFTPSLQSAVRGPQSAVHSICFPLTEFEILEAATTNGFIFSNKSIHLMESMGVRLTWRDWRMV